MRRPEIAEGGGRAAESGREAERSASRPTPLTLVADAVAGQELSATVATVAQALGTAVAVAIPALGGPVGAPVDALGGAVTRTLSALAEAVVAAGPPGPPPNAPAIVEDWVPVRIAERIVGIVAAVATGAPAAASGNGDGGAERRAWLEAAAAAASVTALIHEGQPPHAGDASAAQELLEELAASEPKGSAQLSALLARARRLGVELGAGAVAIAGRRAGSTEPAALPELAGLRSALLGVRAPGRLLGLVPLGDERGRDGVGVEPLLAELTAAGWTVSCAAPRREPAQLHEALREAELLGELRAGAAAPPGQEDTYRLLIGVLLHDPEELRALRERTISALADYDARHETELLLTLHAFLTHDGSTTETAEAMALHRHTVGYRLSRVHEVSGLSPYASDGRERLSLGIKAEQILEADRRRRAG